MLWCVGLNLSLSPLSTHFLFFLQGGIAFVAIKGAFKVYFKQQQYLRQAHRKILNFPEQEEAWGGSAVQREDSWTNHAPLPEGGGEGGCEPLWLWAGSAAETDLGSVSPLTPLTTPGVIHVADINARIPPPPPLHFVFKLSTLSQRWRRMRIVDTGWSTFAVSVQLCTHTLTHTSLSQEVCDCRVDVLLQSHN